MTPELRSALDRIEDVLLTETLVTSKQVWDVLTALRGPDINFDGADQVKKESTSVIRATAFPRLMQSAGRILNGQLYVFGALYNPAPVVAKRHTLANAGYHFMEHTWAAIRALKLTCSSS